VALYALGVGACGDNAVDEKELKYVYHQDGQAYIQVILSVQESANAIEKLFAIDIFIYINFFTFS